MYTAVYGGSFDPPHLGHIMVVSHLLLNDPQVEKVIIAPCFEQEGKVMAPFYHRLLMCQDSFGWLPRVMVIADEATLGGGSLTVRLIRHLSKRFNNLRWVMGADLIEKAKAWEGWEEIEEKSPPLVIGRAGITPLEPGDPTPISPVISSTIVRQALAKKDYNEAQRYLHRSVCGYIEQNELYTAL